MHFFVTGHTGFKGSWLIVLLKELGHEISGFSLPPLEGGLFSRGSLQHLLKHNFVGDIRDSLALEKSLHVCTPDFVIHLAAQPLVLRSYEDPLETYTTNVDGTRNVLQAASSLPVPPVTLVVTTDKVYRDDGEGSYSESDPLGGHDPYSASKAMADIMAQSWAEAGGRAIVRVARAGNVIGAFDGNRDRLLPDIIRAISSSSPVSVRHPQSVRPWQHVLDCLWGYLTFIEKARDDSGLPVAMNFGPDSSSFRTVEEIVQAVQALQPSLVVSHQDVPGLRRETRHLTLDSSRAKRELKWDNRIGFEESIDLTLAELQCNDALDLARSQVRSFLKRLNLDE